MMQSSASKLTTVARTLRTTTTTHNLFINTATNSTAFRQSTTDINATHEPNNNNNADRNTKQRKRIPVYGEPRPSSSTSSSTSSFKQRLMLAVKSAATAFRDPARDDAVAALGEVTGTFAIRRLTEQMRQHPTGQLILQEKPIISKATIPYERFLEEARALGDSNNNNNSTVDESTITFGQAYGRFLLEHGFDPDGRKPILDASLDEDDAYVMLRYRQCHDYWHALTGLPPTVLGELGLKWLELFQTGLPIAALSGTVGSLGLSAKEQIILWKLYVPWAIRVHRQQQQSVAHNTYGGSLLTVYYEKEFDTPLLELRKRIGMEPAPTIGPEYL